jgi:hypothetical protein
MENGGVVHESTTSAHNLTVSNAAHVSPSTTHLNLTPNSVPSTDLYPESTHSSVEGISRFYFIRLTVTLLSN